MTALFSSVIAFLTAHPYVAYLVVFLLALSESIPIVGVVVPGTAVIVALSALVPSGVLVLWPLLLAATLGAIAGDGLSFWLGHHYHREVLGLWPVNRYPELIQKSEAFFARHGDKSVFLARFTPGVRAFIPLFAGILKMPVGRFYAVNVASALVWAPSHILPGVLLGATFGILGAAAKPLAILLVVLVALGWIALHMVRWLMRRGIPMLFVGMERLRDWSGSHEGWLSRQLARLLNPARPGFGALVTLAGILIAAAWLFFSILEDVLHGDPLVMTDTAIFRLLQDTRSGPGDALMIAITEMGDTFVVIAVTAAVLLWLVWQRAWRTALYWLAAVAGASALNTVIKVALHRMRPSELHYSGWSAFSFPSGHSTVNAVLYGFLAILIARNLRPALRVPVALAAATGVFLIAFSRLYLGAHWLSDVLGGLAFGSAWLALIGLAYLRKPVDRVAPLGLLVVGCTALILAGALHIYRDHSKDIGLYAVETALPSEPVAEWWSGGWEELPSYRTDLTGEAREPLTLQWAGSLASIEAALTKSGWEAPTSWSGVNALIWLTAADAAHVPVMPSFNAGRPPGLTLIRPEGNTRLVLRLWAADLDLTNGKTVPLWMGSVVEENLYHPLSLMTVTEEQPGADAPRQTATAGLTGARLVRREAEEAGPDWDAKVLLAGEETDIFHQLGGD
ncbi:phosphatase PAP2 family protein [Nordella sp. HKS 07]|uniref:bifunctional DedA family/phosphatase PAP2 family protein n=1 Tax=Nordella sp. HKS 07 TaxID=2712222 RepID=UPI0013E122DD|nr:bifunctional DedA family/phosphatase PAP2 family protein [Nordella sp. HKS 07]QIG50968.1 phosphatase PAP2 family protein [Nordella sp. HKS 07]